MRKRRLIIFGILLATAVGGLAFYLYAASEPSYQGKPLSRWVSGFEYLNVNPTEEQRTALRAMGEPAVTRLIKMLEARDSLIKGKLVAYAARHANVYNWLIAPRRIIPEDVYHARAATALGEIGPGASAAIPALTAACASGDVFVKCRAEAALMKIRQQPIAPLLVQLAQPDSPDFYQAVMTVKWLGANGEPAVAFLISALQHTNAALRHASLWALQGIASRPEISIPAEATCLTDKDSAVRRGAIDALCEFKREKPQIVPLILPRMQDSDHNVWLGAAFGLEKLLTEDEKRAIYIPALVQSLSNQNPVIRKNAKMFLDRVDPQGTVQLTKK